MPEVSDDSDSEPDISILGMTRGQQAPVEQQEHIATYEDEVMSQEQYEAEDTSVEDDIVEEEQVEEENEVEDEQEEVIPLIDPATMGLKEISNLGKFTVSSHKPGSGVEELRSDDLKLYWQ
jgi:anaphase-promoting complex subunit 10